MGKFLEAEKAHQAASKSESPLFSQAARATGAYRGKPRPFCLPLEQAEENLFPEIRQAAPDYFAANKIKWHDGQDGKPSNHLCDSQVCCVNFLFPFAHKPAALALLLRPIFHDLRRMLVIEGNQYVAFEWIGKENYLGEKISRNGQCTRGANFTSADAAVLFERKNSRLRRSSTSHSTSSCASSFWLTKWNERANWMPKSSVCFTSRRPAIPTFTKLHRQLSSRSAKRQSPCGRASCNHRGDSSA